VTDWENLRHFAALASAGSLSGAARLVGVEHATIARRIARLEHETGLKLVDRRGRRLLLTVDGERIAAVARAMEETALAVERASAGSDPGLTAEVTISAPPAYAAARLAEPLTALRRRHPGLRVRLIAETRHASLDRREADIAIRLSRPTAGELTAVKIGESAMRLYASAAYLAVTPPEAWEFVAFDESMDTAPQQARLLALLGGRAIGLRASSPEVQLAFILAGGGVGMLPDYVAAGQEGLAEAMPAEPPVMRDLWLIVHSDMKDVPAIRAVMAALQAPG
jgi:DNA-binding transcriptional LysR family regulator